MEDYIAAGLDLASVHLLWAGAAVANSLGGHAREILALERILEINPGDANASKYLAVNLLGSQEYRRAAAEFGRLRELGVDEKELIFSSLQLRAGSGRASRVPRTYGTSPRLAPRN